MRVGENGFVVFRTSPRPAELKLAVGASSKTTSRRPHLEIDFAGVGAAE